MADIAGPTILSVTRKQGAFIRVQYEAGASGYTRLYYDVRTPSGPWRQATSETELKGWYEITSIAGAALDANATYQVKMRAAHSSGQPVAESSVVTVGPWEVPTPTLMSAERTDPLSVLVTYADATFTDGGKLYFERRTTPSGTWRQVTATSPTKATGSYPVAVAADSSYEFRIRAGQYGVLSDYSSVRSVNAWTTNAPNVTDAVRTGQSTATISYTGATPGASLVFQRRVQPAGSWVTLSPVTTSTAAGDYTMTSLSGATAYDVRAYVVDKGEPSATSSERALEAWLSTPAGVSDLSAARRPDGTVDLAWTGTSTTRAPYSGQRVYRAEGELGQLEVLPDGVITGTRRSFYDATAQPEREYRYSVAPYNDAGESSSKPVVSSAASILVPNAPGSTTAVWVSDSAADVSWPDPATPERPVSRFVIRRWLRGNWSTVKADQPANDLTWRDMGLAENGVYKYQVQAVNAAGASAAYSPESEEVVTTPTGATTVSAVRVGADVRVSWVALSSSIASSWTVEQTEDANPTPSSEWYPVSAGTLSGSARSVVHPSVAGGVPHTYRVRPTRTGAPTAPWVQSNQVSAFVPPNPPTLTPPTLVDATGVIRVTWTHNPADGTGQTSATVGYRKQGGSWTTTTVTGAAKYFDIPASTFTNGDVVEWRVSTKGQHATASAFTAGSFTTRARPTAGVMYPSQGAVLTSSELVVMWVTSSQSSWTVRLLDGVGNLVDVRSGVSPSTREARFSGLVDRGAYSVELVVRDAFQESPPATVSFTVALLRPAPPTLVATPNQDGGTVSLTATPVQGLRMTRFSFAPPQSGWTLENSGQPVAQGLVMVNGAEQPVMVVQPGQIAQSPQFTVPTVGLVANSFVLADVLSLGVKGMSSILYYDQAGAMWGGNVEGVEIPAHVPTVQQGDVFTVWPDLGRVAIVNAGTAPLYVWNTRGIMTNTGDTSYFDGDTRRDGFIYGWNPDGTAYEAVAAADPADVNMQVAVTSRIELIRVVDGKETPIGDAGVGGQLTDQLPVLGKGFYYIARAWTAAAAYMDSEPVWVRIDGPGVFVNWGPGWENRVSASLELSFDTSTISDVELVHFDRDTGDDDTPNLPVPYGAGTDTHTVAVQAALAAGHGSSEVEWGKVSRRVTVWYRDTAGRSFLANVPSVAIGHPYQGKRTLAFTASEVAS